MSAAQLLDELASMGIRVRLSEGGSLRLKPKARITPDLLERIRQGREQLALLVRERTEIDRISCLDAERRDADRQAGRGYDFDHDAPSHAEYLERTGQRCVCQGSPEEQRERETHHVAVRGGWISPSPAHAIIEVCPRYGVALRIDADGTLVVGRAGASADAPSQPWPSLLVAIEAHLDAVAELIAGGWTLHTDFLRKERYE